MDDVMRVLYPMDFLEEKFEMLIDYYVSQYGRRYRPIINERVSKIMYLFETEPDQTFRFLLDNQNYILDWEYMEQVENWAKDYCNLRKDLEENSQRAIYDVFCRYHSVSSGNYSNKMEEVLKLSEKMGRNQELYEENCFNMGIRPIVDSELVSRFLEEKNKIIQNKDILLINRSLWGRAMKDVLLEDGIKMSDSVFSYLFSLNKHNVAHCINFSSNIFVRIPIIQVYTSGCSVDRVFFHENRHAIECGEDYGIGLSSKKESLRMINEVRTEKHAKEDNELFPTIFSKKSKLYVKIYYEDLFPFCGDLFEKYGSFIDCCAVENNLERFFDFFGKKDICELDQMLTEVYKIIKAFHINGSGILEVDASSYLDKIMVLKDRAKEYQKIKRMEWI